MIKKFLSNISYTVFANLVSVILGVIQIIVIPRFINVENYGYYQLYMFYTTYSLLTSLGLSEGIYLELGGLKLENIDKKKINTQFWIMNLAQTLIYIVLAAAAYNFSGSERRTALIFVCISCIISNANNYIKNIVQAVGEIHIYSYIIIIERVFSVITCIIAVLAGYNGFALLLVLDITARIISVIYGICACREVFMCRIENGFKDIINEICRNINSGIKVLIATYSGMLIVGIIRYGIQKHWDIVTFGKVSLTISISNMFLRCINSIAVVLFPMLRQADKEKLPQIYELLDSVLMTLLLGAFCLYQPFADMLSLWLPQYKDSIAYASLLLPMCIYECKNSMLISTYFKTLRKEKLMMGVNLFSCLVSVVLMAISVFYANNISYAVLSILIVVLFRSIIGEIVLSKCTPIKIYKNMLLEIIMTVAFIICNVLLGKRGIIIFIGCYICYIFLEKHNLRYVYGILRKL